MAPSSIFKAKKQQCYICLVLVPYSHLPLTLNSAKKIHKLWGLRHGHIGGVVGGIILPTTFMLKT